MLPKISAVLRLNRGRDGKFPIVIRVRYKNQDRQVFTGLFVLPEHFNNGVVSGISNASWYNASIKKKVAELEATFLQAELSGKPVILSEKKVNRTSFPEYCYRFYDNSNATPAYRYRAKAAVKYLENYAGDISFEQLTPQLLKDFEQSLIVSRNTINRIFKRIKQPVKMAVREGIISKDPFFLYTPPTYQQPKRDFLTLEEIGAIAALDLPPILANIRAYFLLSCATGLRFSDLQKFDKKKSVIESKGVRRIIIGTTKTKEVVSIKVSERIDGIIGAITDRIPCNVHVNRLLKEIAVLAGIDRSISWHISRHSAAVNMASAGVPIEGVSKILGHSSIRTTQIYFKLVDTKIDEYMDRFEKFGG